MKKILVTITFLLVSLNCHADWLDILVDVTSKMAEEFLSEETPQPSEFMGDRLNLYPQHYHLQKIKEPLHHSELFFLESGDKSKPPLLLVHGLGDLATVDWLNVIPSLEKDYHVYAIDLPGFGLSEHKYFVYSPEQYSKLINWFIQNVMTQASQKPILIGHSMGAAVSLFYASNYPDSIERLVLVSAAGILERTSYLKHLSELPLGKTDQNNIWLGFSRRFNHFSAKWVEQTGQLYDPTKLFNKSKSLRRLMLKENSNLNAGLALMDTNFSLLNFNQLPPTTMIWGIDDPVAPIRTGKALLGKIPGSTLISISNAGHVPMKSQAAEFNYNLRMALTAPIQKLDFLNSQRGSSYPGNKFERVGKCKDDDHTIFEGNYAIIILDNCKKAQLTNVVSSTFFSNHSIVSIENSRIGRVGEMTKIVSSRIEATSSQFTGGLKIKASKIDFASVNMKSKDSALQVEDKSTLIFSLSTIESPFYQGGVHGYFQIENQKLEDNL